MMLLEGFRMLDLSRLAPGPNASRLLADFGMEVIKVEESAPRGGFDRDTLTPIGADAEAAARAAAFNVFGRNKKSIAINLKDPRGGEAFRKLATKADVILEAYRPGVTRRLGIDYETISAVNPGIVYCSISGYGQDGPYANIPGHDANFQALSGLLAFGSTESGEPSYPGYSTADHGAAVHAAMAILAALLGRPKLGRGQYIDIAMSDILTTFMPTHASRYLRDGFAQPRGAEWPHALTVIKCKDGKYLCTQNAETYFWQRFCKAIGRDDLADYAMGSGGERYQYIVREVKEVMLTRTRDDWLDILRAADTCVSPILELGEAIDDPHNRYRGTFWELDHPTIGKVRQVGSPVRFSETPARFRSFAPELGQHTVELLEGAGYPRGAIDQLLAEGVFKASVAASA